MSRHLSTVADRPFPVITWVMIAITTALSIYLMAKLMLTETPINRRFELQMVYLYNNFEIEVPDKFHNILATYDEEKLDFVDRVFDENLRTPEVEHLLEVYDRSGYLRLTDSPMSSTKTAADAQVIFNAMVPRLETNTALLMQNLAFFSPKPRWTRLLSAPFVANSVLLLIFYTLSLWVFGRELEYRMGGFFVLCLAVVGAAVPYLIKHWLSPTLDMLMGPYGLIATLFGASMVFHIHRPFLWRRWVFWIGLGLYCGGRIVIGIFDPTTSIAVDLSGLGLGAVIGLVLAISAWDLKFNPFLDQAAPALPVESRAANGPSPSRPELGRGVAGAHIVEEASQRIAQALEQGQTELAFKTFQEYDRLTEKLLPPKVSLSLVEAMLEAKDEEAALMVAGAITRGSRCGVRTQLELLRLAVRFGQKWGMEVAAKLEGEVLPSREEFKEMVTSLRFTLANQKRTSIGDMELANPFMAPLPSAAPLGDEIVSTMMLPAPEVRDVQLLGIEGQQLLLSFQGKTRTLPMHQIQAMAVGAIKDPRAKPFLAVDLVLMSSGETRKLLRLRSSELDLKRLFPDIEQAAHGFKQLVSLLLLESRATPLPSSAAVMGTPYANYASLEDFTQAVHQRTEDLAFAF